MEDQSHPQIILPLFCYKHQYEIVYGAKYKKTDPWQALIIVVQIAMFQGATATLSVHKRLEDKIENLSKLGCLACRLPQKFQQVLAQKGDLGAIKILGESWVYDNQSKED